MKAYLIAVLVYLLRIFIGPKPKLPRVIITVKDEGVIAEERKHLEELQVEVRRLNNEIDKLAPRITAAIVARNDDFHKRLDDRRNELCTERDTAQQRLDDYQGYLSQGR